MRDEEYIEMETERERYNQEKPVYALRKEDFIPLIGLINHNQRCLEELDKHKILSLSENYAVKSFARDVGLLLYNSAIASCAAYGLLEMLSKN